MTAPVQSKQAASGGFSRNIVFGLVILALAWMALVCAGIVGGVLFFVPHRVAAVVEDAKGSLQGMAGAPQTDWADWNVQRELTHLYQTALESISADTALAEKLGEPIEPAIEADELFTRTTSEFQISGITFDIQGPKGKGTVAVRSVTAQLHAAENIQVTLADGSVHEVAPLDRPIPPVR
jgi:hypothetical protein